MVAQVGSTVHLKLYHVWFRSLIQYNVAKLMHEFFNSAALKGTERLQLEYDGPMINGEDSLMFIPKFIKAATLKAGILE